MAEKSRVEILGFTWASVMSMAAQVPRDAEGLLFGREQDNVIDSFRLLGQLGSSVVCKRLSAKVLQTVQEQEEKGRKLLGWCSLRKIETPATATKTVKPELRLLEQQLHAAVHHIAGDAVVGCVVERRGGGRVKGLFAQDAFGFVGPNLQHQVLKIRNLGATTAKPLAVVQLPAQALLKMSGVVGSIKAIKRDEELPSAIQKQLDITDTSSGPGGQSLHHAQRSVTQKRTAAASMILPKAEKTTTQVGVVNETTATAHTGQQQDATRKVQSAQSSAAVPATAAVTGAKRLRRGSRRIVRSDDEEETEEAEVTAAGSKRLMTVESEPEKMPGEIPGHKRKPDILQSEFGAAKRKAFSHSRCRERGRDRSAAYITQLKTR